MGWAVMRWWNFERWWVDDETIKRWDRRWNDKLTNSLNDDVVRWAVMRGWKYDWWDDDTVNWWDNEILKWWGDEKTMKWCRIRRWDDEKMKRLYFSNSDPPWCLAENKHVRTYTWASLQISYWISEHHHRWTARHGSWFAWISIGWWKG